MNSTQTVFDADDKLNSDEENDIPKDVKIINVISGKGGTGKTCFTNVLANEIGHLQSHMALVIDLDFPVRGTTELASLTNNGALEFSSQKSPSKKVPPEKEYAAVVPFFQAYNDTVVLPVKKSASTDRFDRVLEAKQAKVNTFGIPRLALSKLHSYFIVPAITWIEGDYVNYDPLFDWSVTDISDALKALIKSALRSSPFKDKTFDYIFLDNRAGFDRFVAGAYRISNFSILVQEDDIVSDVTAENLNEQLRTSQIQEKKAITTQILRVRNKVLRDNVVENHKSKLYVSDIPFDMDVMKLFGDCNFWNEIRGTLYHKAVIKAWNGINAKMSLNTPLQDTGPLGIPFKIASKLSILPKLGRILFVYGLMATSSAYILLFALVFSVLTSDMMEAALGFPVKILLLILEVSGVLMTVISMLLIGAKREHPKNKREQDDFTDYPY